MNTFHSDDDDGIASSSSAHRAVAEEPSVLDSGRPEGRGSVRCEGQLQSVSRRLRVCGDTSKPINYPGMLDRSDQKFLALTDLDYQCITVRRCHTWSNTQAFQQTLHRQAAHQGLFIGEPAVDQGSPRREFFSCL